MQNATVQKDIFKKTPEFARAKSQRRSATLPECPVFGRNGNSKTTRHIYPDILSRQCIGKIGLSIEIGSGPNMQSPELWAR